MVPFVDFFITMKKNTISYKETGFFKNIVLDYIHNEQKIKDFYQYRPEPSAFEGVIEDKSREKIDRQTLVEVLKQQYQNINKTTLVEQNLLKLLDQNTFTVTTGHQLNIFTGPLYFIYKIIAAIAAAKDAQQLNPDYHIIPVYWMASEDHDFEEINHLDFKGKRYSWDKLTSGATGKIDPQSLKPLLDDLEIELIDHKFAKPLFQLFSDAYLNHSTLADATRYFVNELFGEFGLLVIDADDKRLKSIFSEIIAKDITEQKSFELVNAQIVELKKSGYDAQVNSREINFFYLAENSRERLVKKDDYYSVLNTKLTFSKDELLKEIKENPEKFSPNVITRPLYQEKILPNLAYIGGGAEVAYWMELSSTFKFYGINFPMLILRPSVLFVAKKVKDKMDRLNVNFKNIFLNSDQLLNHLVLEKSKNELHLTTQKETISNTLLNLESSIKKTDPTLSYSLKALEARISKALNHFEKKLLKAEKKKFEIEHLQLLKIKEELFPKGVLQERNTTIMALEIDSKVFIRELVEKLSWFEMEFSVYVED